MPYGLQKRVDLGRALAMDPQVLLLDEPMAGMNVEEKQDMSRFILDVNDEFGTTIVLIEHDMGVVMDISDRVVVLDYGKKIGDGTPRRGAPEPRRDQRLPRDFSLMGFFLETLFGGLMVGMLYSLIALGFVLIYKASGVFNFAQGAMVLFAALAMARFYEWFPKWFGFENKILANVLAFAGAVLVMIVVAWLIERLVLRKLVNQEHITLLMATLGITYFLEGFGQTLFGSDIYKIDIGMPKDPIFVLESMFQGGVLINKEDLYAAAIAAVLVALLALFFQKTATGRALRAVADDHQAAQSIGIPLGRIWIIVWSVAGFVALVAGVIWGSKLGVQFSLSLVALKALPVVILGGLTSVPGAIIGGLIIGVGEKLSEIYIGPMFGGGIEIWFAYVLALVFLLFRPQGLFGEKIIDRV